MLFSLQYETPTESLIDLDLSLDAVSKATSSTDDRDVLTSSPTVSSCPSHSVLHSLLPLSLPQAMQLQHQLDLERTARHDLEMHSEQLKTQKSILQQELSEAQSKLEKGVCVCVYVCTYMRVCVFLCFSPSVQPVQSASRVASPSWSSRRRGNWPTNISLFLRTG